MKPNAIFIHLLLGISTEWPTNFLQTFYKGDEAYYALPLLRFMDASFVCLKEQKIIK